jgi:hypothetical protein
MGDSGTGKTHSLRTLIDAGLEVFGVFTEPGMESLGPVLDKIPHVYLKPVTAGWGPLLDMGRKVNTMPFEALTKVQDGNRTQYSQFLDLINTFNQFKASDGKDYGDVMTWGTGRALFLDSLSGLNRMAMQLVVGGRPTKSQPDWMIAQDMIRKLLDQLVAGLRCTFVLTAHLDRVRDEITGGTQIMVNSLGQKLAPEIPLFFSDVILTQRVGTEFTWNTAGANVTTKARNIPIADKQPASFVPLLKAWREKGGIYEK